MSLLKIVAAVVDTTEVTLYMTDGSKLTIPQGDPRVSVVVDKVIPLVEQGQVAEVDLDVRTSHFSEFEQMVEGIIRFYRVAKAAFDTAVNRQNIPAGQFGPVPSGQGSATQSAVAEIIANAKPTSDPGFNASDLGSDETIVAVVEEGGQQVAVPGMEKLGDQFSHSAKFKDSIGVQNLIKRMAKMQAGSRQHSVEDLLRFLERADLPIADDGSIIGYKILRRYRGHETNTFVDCHTGKVKQRVGSFVCVAEELVDKNRRNECSNGLHVCRRGYIGNFGGDTVTLIKVAPEDVIVVPHGDANKVRVCGYHILVELPQGSYNRLKNNQPMTDDPEVAKLLGQVLSGNHVGRLEEVQITGQYGEGVLITPLVDGKKPKKNGSDRTGLALDDAKASTRRVDTKELVKKQAKQAKPSPTKPLGSHGENVDSAVRNALAKSQPIPAPKTALPTSGSRQEKAAALLAVINSTASAADRGIAAVNLMSLKRTSKVSYERLGVTISEDRLKEIAEAGAKAPTKAPAPKAKTNGNGAKVSTTPKAPAPSAPAPTGSRQEVARKLFDDKRWSELNAHKRKSKVNWDRLGFSDAEIATIKSKIG
jgi:hypothetical protein